MEASSNATLPVTRSTPTQQISMLEIFLPGSSYALQAFEQLLTGDGYSYAHLACFFGMLAFLSTYTRKLGSWLEQYITSTVHVNYTDEAYDMISVWISSRQLEDAARSSVARVATNQRVGNGYLHHAKKRLSYAPWNGSFFFWYRNHLLSYRTELLDVGFHKEEQVSLTCFGRSSQVLRDLLDDCRDEYLKEVCGHHQGTVMDANKDIVRLDA